MSAFTAAWAVDTLTEVNHSRLLALFAGGSAAFLLSAACGTLLGITPDEQAANEAGGASDGGGEGSALDASGRPDGEGPTPDGFDVKLVPSTVAIVAGNPKSVDVALDVTRTASMPAAPVTVSFESITDLVAQPRPDNVPSAGTLHYDMTALASAPPRRQIIAVTISDGTHTVIRTLTVLLAHHYRAHDTTLLTLTAPATFAIKAWGASGAAPGGGAGGFARGTFALGTGTYAIVVGAAGSGTQGGDPGGGSAVAIGTGKGGGGFSGVFVALADGGFAASGAQLVAGGGGGSCTSAGQQVGGGGGTTGTKAAEDGLGNAPGGGAHVDMGGAAGGNGTGTGEAGTMLQGGNGGSVVAGLVQYGGGGGGGYWGGGGGGVDEMGGTGCSAGGGGSSFVIASATASLTQGASNITPGESSDGDIGAAATNGHDGAVIVVPQ